MMTVAAHAAAEERKSRPGRATLGSAAARWACIAATLAFLTALLLAPLAIVVVTALSKGIGAYFGSFAVLVVMWVTLLVQLLWEG